jgi:hypothetical protein
MRRIEEISSTEVVLGVLLLVLLGGIVAAFAIQVATNEDYLFNVNDQAFPNIDLEGWRAPRQVDRFTADNLYVKIDGRADVFLQFHVVGLTFGTYYHTSDPERTVDVYWYDMGEPVNAYGVYRTEASPEAEPVAIGREGYQTGGAVFFCQGASYVQVLPTRDDPADARVARGIAQRLAEQVGDGGDTFWAEAVLPKSNRVEDSLAFIAQDAFGLDFLTEVFTAEYDSPGQRITLFVHRAADEAAAAALLEKYQAFFEEYGRLVAEDSDASRRIVAGEVAGLVDVVFVKGRYLAGVAGAESAAVAQEAATDFYNKLEDK